MSIPQPRLSSGLGTVQGAQYAGTTIGPAVGALLASVLDIRGAIVISALMPAVAATMVLFVVPRDPVGPRTASVAAEPPVRRWTRSLRRDLSLQFGLGLLLYFSIFTMTDLVRTAAPAAIAALDDVGNATRATGAAFTVSGLASVIGALGLTRLTGRSGRVRVSLAVTVAVCAFAHIALGLATSVTIFIAAYALASLARGALLPATNTVIAASVPRERRGTAFGIASAVQALAFIVGPWSAAAFAVVSLSLGFITLGVALAAIAVVIFIALREPDLEQFQSSAGVPLPPTPSPRKGGGAYSELG